MMNTSRNVMFSILASGALVLMVIIICVSVNVANRDDGSTGTSTKACPPDYVDPLLLLVSMDGFRASYLSRGLTPTLDRLKTEGSYVQYMNPSYPTSTFPNHYSIVTGLYPEKHGIIANSFYDPVLGSFTLSNGASTNGAFWSGEPLWNTLTLQNKTSATYFWPGSDADIGGMYPTYWYPYNSSVPFEDRVDQVLEWVKMPAETRPAFITLYFNEPDHTGHDFGPDATEVNDALVYMDSLLESLISGLELEGLFDCVNMIVLADHGMAGGGPDWVIPIKDYIPNLYEEAFSYGGAFTRINPKDKAIEVRREMQQNLTCKRSDMRQYEREGLPTRLHFSDNPRIEDIVLDLDPGRAGSTGNTIYYNLGNHGYDNYNSEMNALFVARGPDFKVGYIGTSFQNIELYNLMAHLTKVKPAVNNGTFGSLNGFLVNPPPVEELSDVPHPMVPAYPADVNSNLGLSGCPGDLSNAEPWLDELNFNATSQASLEKYHLPWGIPRTDSNSTASVVMLHQHDHVTGYSELRKQAMWVSFTVDSIYYSTAEEEWSSDVRLDLDNSANCSDYDNLLMVNGTVLAPLFPPVFSSYSNFTKIPYLVSNMAPSSEQQQNRWNELMSGIVKNWLASFQLNVVVGPVYDNDANSWADELPVNGAAPVMPSDWFAVFTRCITGGQIGDCDPENLESRAFIYPTVTPVENCLEAEKYALEFSSTLRDVRKISGLTFYSSLTTEQRIKLEIAVNQQLW